MVRDLISDWIGDLGLKGRSKGGIIIVECLPVEIAKCPENYTGVSVILLRVIWVIYIKQNFTSS